MLQRADHVYRARLLTKVSEGGFWHRHSHGIEPFGPQGVHLDVVRCHVCPNLHQLIPRVDHGRWIVDCPDRLCNGAQLAGPDGPGFDRFFCIDCLNADVGHQWLQVQWPDASDLAAIEAALEARPNLLNRNWDHTETIGALMVENAVFGHLYDEVTGEVAGDTGADKQRPLVAPKGLKTLPTGDG